MDTSGQTHRPKMAQSAYLYGHAAKDEKLKQAFAVTHLGPPHEQEGAGERYHHQQEAEHPGHYVDVVSLHLQ